MIVRLNENNTLELTEKAMFIKDFRDMYNYYSRKLNNEDRAMAAFAMMYYMYYFDSRFIIEYKDEKERFKAIKEFVYKGNEITEIKIFQKASETYQKLMDEEQTDLYVVMKANTYKLKEYAKNMVLIKPSHTGEEVQDAISDAKEIYVSFSEFSKINLSLPEQEEGLRKFKERLQKHFKSEVDVYGGGDIGAYE